MLKKDEKEGIAQTCYNGSATNHKTREGMPCGDYNIKRANTQILFREAFGFFDKRTPATASGNNRSQLCEGEQRKNDGLIRGGNSPSDNLWAFSSKREMG